MGRVRSYVREHGDIIVYADPRDQKRIWFRVFRRRPEGTRAAEPFDIWDVWRIDLRKKYEKRLADAICQLDLTGNGGDVSEETGSLMSPGVTRRPEWPPLVAALPNLRCPLASTDLDANTIPYYNLNVRNNAVSVP